jgi:hypothetical protein
MKIILTHILCLLCYINAYGVDHSVIPVVVSDLTNDDNFSHYSSITKKIYVWGRIPKRIDYNGNSKDVREKEKMVRNILGCDIYDTISIQDTKYRFKYKETTKERIWARMGANYNFCKKSVIIIKPYNIYQCSDSVSYCFIRVYLNRRYFEYEYVLKKENGMWVIADKTFFSDSLI